MALTKYCGKLPRSRDLDSVRTVAKSAFGEGLPCNHAGRIFEQSNAYYKVQSRHSAVSKTGASFFSVKRKSENLCPQ